MSMMVYKGRLGTSSLGVNIRGITCLHELGGHALCGEGSEWLGLLHALCGESSELGGHALCGEGSEWLGYPLFREGATNAAGKVLSRH
jgi:hypothetical protein